MMGRQVVRKPYPGTGSSLFLKGDYDEVTGFFAQLNLHHKFGKKPIGELK